MGPSAFARLHLLKYRSIYRIKEIMFRSFSFPGLAGFLCLLLLASPEATAKSSSKLEKLLNEAQRAEFSDKENTYEKWLAVENCAAKAANPAVLAVALEHLAESISEKDADNAIDKYKRAIELRKRDGVGSPLGLARCLLRYSFLCESNQKEVPLDSVLSEALAIANKGDAPETLKYQIMSALADEYCRERKYKEAEDMCAEILKLANDPTCQNARGKKLAAYGTLTLIYSQKNEYEKGEHTRDLINELSKVKPDAAEIQAASEELTRTDELVDAAEMKAAFATNEKGVNESQGKATERELKTAELIECIKCEDLRLVSDKLQEMLVDEKLEKGRILLSIARIGDEKTIPLLLDLAKRQSSNFNSIVWCTGEMENSKSVEFLVDTLANGSTVAKALAAESLGKILANKISAKELEGRKTDLVKNISRAIDNAPDTREGHELISKGMIAILRAADTEGLKSVAKQLQSSSETIRWQSANVLARSKKELQPYLVMLRKNIVFDTQARRDSVAYAIRALGVAKDKESVELLRRLLVSDDSFVVRSCVVALGSIGDKSAVPDLLKYGEAELAKYRMAKKSGARIPSTQNELLLLASTLGSIADPSAIPFLKSLRAEMLPIRLQPEIEIALAKFGDEAFFDESARKSAEGSWQSEAAFAQGLGELKTERARETLLQLWQSNKDPRSKADLLNAVAACKISNSQQIVLKCLLDEDVIVKAGAASLLAESGLASDDVITALHNAFVASRNDAMNDARLSILDAADQLKHPFNKEVLEDRNEQDYLVKKKAFELARLADLRSFPNYKLGPVNTKHGKEYYRRVAALSSAKSTAKIRTVKGDIVIQLLNQQAPMTVDNFISLSSDGYFNKNITFMRVVPNFVVQSGDPRNDMNGGPGYQIRCEINRAEYDGPGVVGMALSGKDTGGSQFFITHSAQPHLDGSYTIFGKVISGMNVVESIARGDEIARIKIVEAEN